jgi:peptide/nickel transport system substrate-binding protein
MRAMIRLWLLLLVIPLTLALAACGGDEEEEAATPEATRVAVQAPVIGGAPEAPAQVPATPVPAKEEVKVSEEDEKYGGSLKFIPNGGISGPDPIRGGDLSFLAALNIHDPLIAWDNDGNLQPQMLDQWKIENDGKLITLTLRDGLLFHNLEPVTPADIIQSIHRWRSKAVFGTFFNENLVSMTSPNDNTIVAEFTEPSGVFIQGLGDPSSPSPIMVPEYLAKTPKEDLMPENIGAGVYKMISFDEGNKMVWEGFRDYNPRSEPASFRAGGKHGYLDTIEGVEVPETQTRVAALVTGQVDFLDIIPPDFVGEIERNPELTALISQPGAQYFVELNKWDGSPFEMTEEGQLMRKAIQALVDTDEIMASFGPEDMWMTCASMWACGTRYGNENVNPELYNQKNVELAKKYLEEAGYAGEPIIMIHSTGGGEAWTAFATVLNEQLKRAEVNVDFKIMDSAAMSAYRDATGNEGWHISPTYMTSWSWRPIASRYSTYDLSGYDSPRMRDARLALTKEADAGRMQALADEMQSVFFEEVPYVLAGHAFFLRAMNSDLEGYIDMPIDGVYFAELRWKPGKQR